MQIPKRIENILMNALKGGVVPRTGLGYIAVGREQEIKALTNDIDIIEDGGSTFRFVVGSYGSGKTFLLQTIKEHALERGFIVVDADLSPDRSLIGTSNKKRGLATFRELMGNLSVKGTPEGGALESVLDKWLNSIWIEIACNSGEIDGMQMQKQVFQRIYETIMGMQDLVHGYDFATVLTIYWQASREQDIEKKAKAVRWLRGEYNTKTEAKTDIGVSNIINDEDWFDYIKLLSQFFTKIGYKGFILMIDEMINIYRMKNTEYRQRNYEKMLLMYNDALQGKAKSLGIILSGTPRSVEDIKRGVYSYDALKSRLQPGRFYNPAMIDLMSPIIRIQALSKSEIFVLLEKLTEIHADLYSYEIRITDEDILTYIKDSYAASKMENITPRSIIRDYIEVMNLMYQNSDKSMKEILGIMKYTDDEEGEITDISE